MFSLFGFLFESHYLINFFFEAGLLRNTFRIHAQLFNSRQVGTLRSTTSPSKLTSCEILIWISTL